MHGTPSRPSLGRRHPPDVQRPVVEWASQCAALAFYAPLALVQGLILTLTSHTGEEYGRQQIRRACERAIISSLQPSHVDRSMFPRHGCSGIRISIPMERTSWTISSGRRPETELVHLRSLLLWARPPARSCIWRCSWNAWRNSRRRS